MLFERVLSEEEKISLKKHCIVETINDQLKNILHIVHKVSQHQHIFCECAVKAQCLYFKPEKPGGLSDTQARIIPHN